jgi:hypothetical protein
MQHFYDGQVRRYLNQMLRLLSNFTYKDGSGKITPVPVMYGDITRQVSSIIRDNSENKIPSAPRIGMYVTAMEQDRTRTSDATLVSKVNIRERAFDEVNQRYTTQQGNSYTVERLMPSPYTLTVSADIWSTNTDQKLQIIEQILTLFNPSLEIQTTDNFIDWTSLSVVNLEGITWSSRSIPQGTETEIDVSTLSFSTPIYISPPVKVKQLGVITAIAMSIGDEDRGTIETGINIPGDSILFPGWDQTVPDAFSANLDTAAASWHSLVFGNTIKLVKPMGLSNTSELEKATPSGAQGNWQGVLDALPGTYRAGLSKIFLRRDDSKTPIVGYLTLNPLDETQLTVNWDIDTQPTNSTLVGPLRSDGNINAVVDPVRNPPAIVPGVRFLLTADIGSESNLDGPDFWKNTNGVDFVAGANDIIEWNGTAWTIIFDASEYTGDPVYVTNINPNSGLQFKWDGEQWIKAWEGLYKPGHWQVIL